MTPFKIFALLKKAYDAFNSRDIETALNTMHHDVQWPKAFEGGFVYGHQEIRAYWTRQWSEIDPLVTPVSLESKENGSHLLLVHQLVKDIEGNVLFNGNVNHEYIIKDQLIWKMIIHS